MKNSSLDLSPLVHATPGPTPEARATRRRAPSPYPV